MGLKPQIARELLEEKECRNRTIMGLKQAALDDINDQGGASQSNHYGIETIWNNFTHELLLSSQSNHYGIETWIYKVIWDAQRVAIEPLWD